MARYPYKAKFPYRPKDAVEGIDYWVWRDKNFDLGEVLAKSQGDLLELAGPTLTGYYFLDDVTLPRAITITNIFKEPYHDEAMNRRARKRVSKLVDARDLPYKDNELSLVLAHYLSYGLDEELHTRKSHESKNWLRGKNEMAEMFLGLRKISEADFAQRIQMLHEAYRALEPGGILITDGQLSELTLMKKVGFIPRAMYVDGLDMEEVVLQKP